MRSYLKEALRKEVLLLLSREAIGRSLVPDPDLDSKFLLPTDIGFSLAPPCVATLVGYEVSLRLKGIAVHEKYFNTVFLVVMTHEQFFRILSN